MDGEACVERLAESAVRCATLRHAPGAMSVINGAADKADGSEVEVYWSFSPTCTSHAVCRQIAMQATATCSISGRSPHGRAPHQQRAISSAEEIGRHDNFDAGPINVSI
jgi:hypothetical protein